jgi:hypothetical protein
MSLTIYEGYKSVEAEILNYTTNAGELAIRFLGPTYHVYNYPEPEMEKFLSDKLAGNKTSPQIKKLFKVQVLYKNISRACLARLTRDESDVINSESHAVPGVDPKGKFKDKHVNWGAIIPASIERHPEAKIRYIELLHELDKYRKYLEDNDIAWAPDVRYILPCANTINIAFEYNARQFIGLCNRRIINSVGDEDNYAVRKALFNLKNKLNKDYDEGKITNLTYKLWNNIFAECVTKGEFIDENLGKQLSDRGVPFWGDCEKPFYDKTEASMYYELIRLLEEEPGMLMPGESDMIKKWVQA